MANLLKEYGCADTTNKNFTLQNGYHILKKYFSEVQRYDYKDSLEITDIDDLIDYIYSLTNMTFLTQITRKDMKDTFENKMVNGVLKIQKEYGMFICKK